MPPGRGKEKPDKKTKASPSPKSSKSSARPQRPESSDSEEDVEVEGGYHVCGYYIPPPPVATCSSDAVGTRAIITHIVNENFKSYAGRQVLGPFHKSFTSIIGPNGSGKSNVIDSMLFVFGYRASKIRSKKLSVLLHSSENHTNVKSCTVSVHFVIIKDMPGEEFEVIPNSEFVISRTANHDNSSHYSINGRRTQFKDVALLLRSHGIDLIHNRFLILQGEVEQIALMKPKGATEHETGMLEYLEDIIGTSRFKKPLSKLEEQLNELNEDRQEKLGRAKTAEKEKEMLREPMRQAVEYLKLSNEKAVLVNQREQNRLFFANKDWTEANAEKTKLLNHIQECKDGAARCEKEQKAKTAESEKKTAEIDKATQDKEKAAEHFRRIETRSIMIKEEITSCNKRRKKAMENKKAEDAKLEEWIKLPEKNAKEIEELTKVVEKLTKEKEVEEAAADVILKDIDRETKPFQDRKDVLNNQLIDFKKTKDEANAKYMIAKSELEFYISGETKAKEAFEKAEASLLKISTLIKGNRSKIQDLKSKLPEAEALLADNEKEFEVIQKEDIKLKQELTKQRAMVQERKHAMQASKSKNKVLDFLMQKKEEGALPGIFGRLGDLGGVDAKYDCAVSTACGVLDYIVCDSVTTAKNAVLILKKFNVGRGSFIALDQQQHLIPAYSKPIKTPENALRLFDLITVPDERIRPAFYYGLRDTLVANDLEQARRVAYGKPRFRVVTLKGEIIEIVGTLSGGGAARRGRIGRSASVRTDVSPAALGKMEEDLASLEQKASELYRSQSNLEGKIVTLKRNIKSWSDEIEDLRAEINELSSQEPTLKRQMKESLENVKRATPNPEELQKKTDLVNSLKQKLDEATNSSKDVENEVTELNSKINAVAGNKMKAARQKVDTVTKQLDRVTTEIAKLQVAVKSCARNKKKTQERVNALAKEISESEKRILGLQEENDKLTLEGASLNEKIETLNATIEQLQTDIQDLKQSLSDLGKEENVYKTAIVEDESKLDEVTQRVKSCEASKEKHEKRLREVSIKAIPDQEIDLVLPKFSEEELTMFDPDKLKYKILLLDRTMSNLNPNLDTIEEYKKKSEIFDKRYAELESVTARRDEIRAGFEELRKCRLNEFIAGFSIISNKLKEMYQMITFGGDAELDLSDSLDPFNDGVLFSVRPPKKSWKQISNLSGGEKTLSSLALVFALHYYKPSPLYVMDEIDAALDFKNVSIVGNYIKERTRNSQFIIISLRSNMFELADLLVGIYKTNNCTKSVTITPGVYCKLQKEIIDQQRKHKDKDPSDEQDVCSPPPSKLVKTA